MDAEIPYVHLSLRNNILIGTYRKNLHIDLHVAREIVRIRLSFTHGKIYPSLILSKGIISIDKPAREYLASKEAIEGLLASAIVVESTYSSFLGNFFLAVNKTKLPVKIFTDESLAEKWLQQFIV